MHYCLCDISLLCGTLQHLQSIFLPYLASPFWMHACLCALAIPLAQKLDVKVMSQSLIWTAGAGLATSSALISLSHSFFNTFSLFILLTPSFTPPLFLVFLLSMFGVGPPSLPPSSADIWFAFRNQTVHIGREARGDRKLWLCASTVIFFITEPALTQIMECTGSLSERQRGKSGPLPTLGYANPFAAVWV